MSGRAVGTGLVATPLALVVRMTELRLPGNVAPGVVLEPGSEKVTGSPASLTGPRASDTETEIAEPKAWPARVVRKVGLGVRTSPLTLTLTVSVSAAMGSPSESSSSRTTVSGPAGTPSASPVTATVPSAPVSP